MIFSPMVMTLEEHDLGNRMAQWVKDGGTWVVGPLTDVRNIHGARYQDRFYGVIEALTGVQWRYAIPDTEAHVKAQWSDGAEFVGDTWFEVSENAGADSLVNVTACHSAVTGKSLVYQKKVGKGCVIVLGTVPSENDMKKLIALACAQGGVAVPQVTGEVMAVRRSGEAGEGVMLIEYGAKEASYALDAPMVDLLTGERLAGTIALHPYDVKVLKKA